MRVRLWFCLRHVNPAIGEDLGIKLGRNGNVQISPTHDATQPTHHTEFELWNIRRGWMNEWIHFHFPTQWIKSLTGSQNLNCKQRQNHAIHRCEAKKKCRRWRSTSCRSSSERSESSTNHDNSAISGSNTFSPNSASTEFPLRHGSSTLPFRQIHKVTNPPSRVFTITVQFFDYWDFSVRSRWFLLRILFWWHGGTIKSASWLRRIENW